MPSLSCLILFGSLQQDPVVHVTCQSSVDYENIKINHLALKTKQKTEVQGVYSCVENKTKHRRSIISVSFYEWQHKFLHIFTRWIKCLWSNEYTIMFRLTHSVLHSGLHYDIQVYTFSITFSFLLSYSGLKYCIHTVTYSLCTFFITSLSAVSHLVIASSWSLWWWWATAPGGWASGTCSRAMCCTAPPAACINHYIQSSHALKTVFLQPRPQVTMI